LEEYYGGQTNLTEALTLEANKAIDEAVEEGIPFYINMAHYTVHTPIMADRRYYQDYLKAGLDSSEAKYASMIEGMDRSLGSILQNLEEEGVAEQTMILFTSDNGGLSVHSRGATPAGTGANTHNAPLRSGKGSAYDGGIRVPMIVSWAKRAEDHPMQNRYEVRAGGSNDTPVISQDLYPTVLELAGWNIRSDTSLAMDGRSFVPLLKSDTSGGGERALFWHYPHKWGPEGPGYEPFSAVREGQWRLIHFYNDQSWELYNIAGDIGETHNLAAEEKETAGKLA